MKLSTEFCVIGTGAGGGMVAYTLAKAGHEVVVINSGKIPLQSVFRNELSPEQRGDFGVTKEMTFPASTDVKHVHPVLSEEDEKSLRPIPQERFLLYESNHVNGLQNLWGGTALRFSVADFSNEFNFNSQCKWPISYEDMDPHYSAVERLARVVGEKNGLDQFPDGDFSTPLPLRDIDRLFYKNNRHLVRPDFAFFASRNAVNLHDRDIGICTSCGQCVEGCRVGSVFKFSTHLYPKIRSLPGFRLLEDTRCVRLENAVAPNHGALVYTLNEKTGEKLLIEADTVVVSAGAFESTRLLLNSFSADVPGMEQVGRYVQDSPPVVIGTSLIKAWLNPVVPNKGYGDHLSMGGELNADRERFPFLAQLWSDFIHMPIYQKDIQFVPRPFRKIFAKKIYANTVALVCWAPSVPQKENRLELSNAVDRYGQRQLDIQYQRMPKEKAFDAALKIFGKPLLKNAGGYVTSLTPMTPGMGIHYAGSCRMGDSPDNGVVDKNLKFFGSENIYVCNGGVIPHLNEKHLTLTIMALGHRLGTHLNQVKTN